MCTCQCVGSMAILRLICQVDIGSALDVNVVLVAYMTGRRIPCINTQLSCAHWRIIHLT